MADSRQQSHARRGSHVHKRTPSETVPTHARPTSEAGRSAAHSTPVGTRPASHSAPAGTRPASAGARPTSAGAYRATTPSPNAYRPAAASPGGFRPAQPTKGGSGGQRQSPGKPGKKKGGPWRAVFWVALAVLLASLIALGVIAYNYWQGQQLYDEIADQGFVPPTDIEGTALADITVDWDALKAINPDTVGWIYIPDTQVNYPIVHTTDNEKYLTRDFKGTEGWLAQYGAIFLAAENKGDFSDPNNILYGHNMQDGSMFACVSGFTDAAQFAEHRTIYLLTPQGNYRLQTFALIHTTADDLIAQTTFTDEEQRLTYLQDKIDRSVASVDDVPAVSEMSQSLMLSTCDNLPTDGRYVLYAYVAESTVKASSDASQGGAASPDAVDAVDEASKELAS